MTRTSPGPPARRPGQASREPGKSPDAARPTRRERPVVLGGFAVAALATAPAFLLAGDLEVVAALWLAAAVWAFVASLALALRRGFRDGDWSAFRRSGLPDDSDTLDWSLKSGSYAYMAVAEEHERLMRGD